MVVLVAVVEEEEVEVAVVVEGVEARP